MDNVILLHNLIIQYQLDIDGEASFLDKDSYHRVSQAHRSSVTERPQTRVETLLPEYVTDCRVQKLAQ